MLYVVRTKCKIELWWVELVKI